MLLVYGTSYENGLESLEKSIPPKGKFFQGEWDVTSCRNATYLTDSYGLNFAFNQTKKFEKIALVEVDTDKLQNLMMVADEDALEQSYRMSKDEFFPLELRRFSIEERTFWFANHLGVCQILGMGHEWSLDSLGTCAHIGLIPHEAVTKVVFVEDICAMWWLQFFNATLSLATHHFMGKQQRIFQKVIMGHLEDALREVGEDNYRYVQWVDEIVKKHVSTQNL